MLVATVVAGTVAMVAVPVVVAAIAGEVKAAQAAILLARKQPLADKTVGVNNGKKDVPSILLDTIAVDKSNIMQTVVADGYHKLEDICRDLPKEQCPKQ